MIWDDQVVPGGVHAALQVVGFSSCSKWKTPPFNFLGQLRHFSSVRPGLLENIRKKKKSFHGQPRGCSSFLLVEATSSRYVSFWIDEEGRGHCLLVLLCSLVHGRPCGTFFPHLKKKKYQKHLILWRANVLATYTKGVCFKDDRN